MAQRGARKGRTVVFDRSLNETEVNAMVVSHDIKVAKHDEVGGSITQTCPLNGQYRGAGPILQD